VAQTRAVEILGAGIRQQVGRGFPLVHVDSSPVLQMHLGTANPLVSLRRAAQLLSGEAAAFVAVNDADAALAQLATNGLFVVAEAPRTRRTRMAVLSNRPRLTWRGSLATAIGPLRVKLDGVKRVDHRAETFRLEADSKAAYVELTNESEKALNLRVQFVRDRLAEVQTVTLAPGEARKVSCP
jgi:hypothetical protein